MPHVHDSAVVLGASISGLLTARALSPHFSRITIVDRDVLPEGPDLRKGVPQAGHAHGLLASGYRVIDSFFPGIMADLEARGAECGDVVGNFLWFQYGHWKWRHDCGLRGITVSRPCLEAEIRRRVKQLPNVTFLEGTDARKPVFDASTGHVTGLTVRTRGTDADAQLAADLVVDASGRGSQSPAWLAEWGFGQPPAISVKIDVGYATRVFERRPGDFFNSMGGVISGTPPADTRYAAILAAEGNRWVVTLTGSVGDHPPTDEPGWMAFAASLHTPVVHDLAAKAVPLSDIVSYKFPANQRRLYEKMARFPAGYLVVGDAVCSFNPIYGQGMSVAAMESRALDECMAGGLDGLAPRFYAKASKIIDIPWLIATGEDLRYPQVEGARPAGFNIVNRYLERVHAVASDDPVVCRKFFDVLNLLAAPPSLMMPAVAWRVLARRAPRGSGTPWGAFADSTATVMS
jgi:2-polyprenyl-6-methoxyphenol hydroxylase-like FAD-dependent oxidoreductase